MCVMHLNCFQWGKTQFAVYMQHGQQHVLPLVQFPECDHSLNCHINKLNEPLHITVKLYI